MTRTWRYGATREVEVLDVETLGGFDVIRCHDVKAMGRESFVVLADDGRYRAVMPGDRGIITFTRGGPRGGHWVYSGGEGDGA